MNISNRRIACLALLGLACLGPRAAASAEPTKVTLAYIGITTSNWPDLVARDKGYFAAEGLDVDWVQTGQSAKVVQLVMSGGAEMGNSSVPDACRPIDSGGNVVVFLSAFDNAIHSLVVAKTIGSIKDLKGKRVIVGGQKDITALWWDAAARHEGLDPTKAVDLLFAGSTSNRLAALLSGGVEATIIGPPASFDAVAQGFTDLGLVAPYLGDFPMQAHIVNRSWAEKNKGTVVAFTRAVNRATQYLLDPQHRKEVSQILADASETSLDYAEKTYDLALKANSYSPDGSISTQGIKNILEYIANEGDIQRPIKPLNLFYDPQYVDAANGR